MPEIIVFLTTGRCGSNIILNSIIGHYASLNFNYIRVYSDYVNFDSKKVLTELEKKQNLVLFTHSDISEDCIECILKNYKITTIGLQRKDTYTWFLSNYFNSKFLAEFWIENPHRVIYNQQEQDKLIKFLTKQNIKTISIKNLEMIGLIEKFVDYVQLKNRFVAASDQSYRLFYEDLLENTERECAKIGIKFIPEKATLKFKKPKLEDVFDNIEQSRNIWYNLLNKRLKICGITE